MDAASHYSDRARYHTEHLARTEARFRVIGTLRVACVVVALGSVFAMVFGGAPAAVWALVVVAIAAFSGLVVVHARIDRARSRARAALAYAVAGKARLSGDTSASRTGDAFADPTHAYSSDLDVFGRASLFALVSTARTRGGEAMIASWLSAPAPDASAIEARQDAAKELSNVHELRESIAVLGATLGGDHDPKPMLAWLDSAAGRTLSPLWKVAPVGFPIVVIAGALASAATGGSNLASVAPYALAVGLGVLLRARTQPILSNVSSREGGLSAYAELFELVETARFQAPRLRALQAHLGAGPTSATAQMKRLSTILGFADATSNEVFRLLVAPVFAFEPRVALSLESWRIDNAPRVRGWLEALGEIEALASFGTFAFEDSTRSWPSLSSEPELVAKALAHPLIAAGKRVANDVSLAGPGHALVVTGSNMSGKSTLMRAMGANVVLALAGAPVCAAELRVGMLRVATSMRVADSLADSTSRFYAELKKLKLVVDLSSAGPGVFFLLDEILHGTNSRERLIGARALVRKLLAEGALGAVSTHDLALGDLETELPGRVRNVHFEEQVHDETMTFDYTLRSGVVQSSNALRLMKMVGLDVDVGSEG